MVNFFVNSAHLGEISWLHVRKIVTVLGPRISSFNIGDIQGNLTFSKLEVGLIVQDWKISLSITKVGVDAHSAVLRLAIEEGPNKVRSNAGDATNASVIINH